MTKLLPVAHPSVIYKSLADGAVLFSTSDEVYFGLNAVGARVWELLPPALATVDELCGALERQFPDVGADVIRADILELLADLSMHGLVVPREAEHADAKDVARGVAQADRASARGVG